MLEVHIEKAKVGKGRSYVIQTSWLIPLVEEIQGSIEFALSVNYVHHQNKNGSVWIIHADFWLPNANVDHHRFHITPGFVKSEERKATVEVMKSTIIPELVEWMNACVNPPMKRKYGNTFAVYRENGTYLINGKPIK